VFELVFEHRYHEGVHHFDQLGERLEDDELVALHDRLRSSLLMLGDHAYASADAQPEGVDPFA
jgi:hypothetical protein